MSDPTPPGLRAKKITEQVHTYLTLAYPLPVNAKTISTALGVNNNTVKGALQRLVASKCAERVTLGEYRGRRAA
jgi:predicted ArsR family transcriptional regulator